MQIQFVQHSYSTKKHHCAKVPFVCRAERQHKQKQRNAAEFCRYRKEIRSLSVPAHTIHRRSFTSFIKFPILLGSKSHTQWCQVLQQPCYSRSGFSSGSQIPEPVVSSTPKELPRDTSQEVAQGRCPSAHKPQALHSLTTGTNMPPQALGAASSGTGTSIKTALRGEALEKQEQCQTSLLCSVLVPKSHQDLYRQVVQNGQQEEK